MIHAQVTVPAGYAACQLGKRHGIPVVITEHASYFERFFRGKERPYGMFAAENAAKITFVSSYMKDIFEEKTGISADVLPNIVDCSDFALPRNIDPNGPLELVTICALRPGKQIHIAAEALKLLMDAGKLPAFRYTVIGDGAHAEIYKTTVRELGMEAYVDFVGTKTRQEIAQILSRSHMLLLPSEMETFGIPAVEALAAGVPVVCTRCKGPETYLTPECAELCAINDPQSMADAIERMLLRLSQLQESDLRAAAARFHSSSVAALAMDLYKKAQA